jgi:hypothetical protein
MSPRSIAAQGTAGSDVPAHPSGSKIPATAGRVQVILLTKPTFTSYLRFELYGKLGRR